MEILSEISEKQIEVSSNQTESSKIKFNNDKNNDITRNSFEFPIGKVEKSNELI